MEALILMGVLVSGNIGDSIWVAYTAARDLNGGGYPVLVHVVISFLILAIFSGVWIVSEGAEPWPLVAATIVVPALQFLAIGWADRLGAARRRRR